MKDVKTLKNQNLQDITLQTKGNFEQLFEISLANGFSITDLPAPGTRLLIPKEGDNLDILGYYKIKKAIPATANPNADIYIQQLFENGLFQPGLFE